MPSFHPAPGVELLPFKGESVLFDQSGQRLFYLNAAATLIWSHLKKKRDVEDIAEATAQAMCVDRARARQYVLDMLKTWRATSLLQGGCHAPPPERAGDCFDESASGASDEDLQQPVMPVRQRYQFLDSVFSLGFTNAALSKLVDPIFQHLRTRAEAKDVFYLNVIDMGDELKVVHNTSIIGRCDSPMELCPLLHGLIGLLAIRRCNYLLAIHASCLVRSGSVLLLPGRSGSGKTTMAAALMAAGWEYMSDDTALLLPQTLACVGVPYALTLKEGAWSIVQRLFPTVDCAPIHLRSDGRLVRYLCPSRHEPLEPHLVRWVAFPHRSTTATSSIRPLDQVEGLCRTLEHCCAIPHVLNASDIQLLVGWSANCRFFDFATTDINEAVAQVEAMTCTEGETSYVALPISDDSRKMTCCLHT